MHEHIWMNLIDSGRELLVLTIAGIIVFKMDHKEQIKRGVGWLGDTCKLAKKVEPEAAEDGTDAGS